ncbi:hypothetical protein [Acinetobacter lactucae]|uniref:hypothetical protein n=1 Tax=Acinetobacter lactucae TaxID=1785128 RepID=UPI00077E37EE|nr:hypothetical protein [Acinetobacter lactucae]
MQTRKRTHERDIAKAAADILRECFIRTARSEKVLYVENDILWSKIPDGEPVFIKQLSGRNPSLSKEITNRRIFKIKKRNVNASNKVNS